ncbi:Serine/threonine-protein phosphatase 6 regulatory subunit 2 [Balamuthia mandrillaris]
MNAFDLLASLGESLHLQDMIEQKSHFTLEFLEEEDFLTQVKLPNPKLLSLILERGVREKLVDLALFDETVSFTEEEGGHNLTTPEQRFRYAFLCCEMFCLEVDTLMDAFLGSDDDAAATGLLHHMLDFLDRDPPLNSLSCQHMSKILLWLIKRRRKQTFDCLKGHKGYVDRLVLQAVMSSQTLAEPLLILFEDELVSPIGVAKWLAEEDFIGKLFQWLGASHVSTVQTNALQLLSQLISVSSDTSPLVLDILEVAQRCDQLLALITSKSVKEQTLKLVAGLECIRRLLDWSITRQRKQRRASTLNKDIAATNGTASDSGNLLSDTLPDALKPNSASPSEADLSLHVTPEVKAMRSLVVELNALFDAILSQLPIFLNLLQSSLAEGSPTVTLAVLEVLASALATNNPQFIQAFVDNSVLPACLDVFFAKPRHNVLHHQIGVMLTHAMLITHEALLIPRVEKLHLLTQFSFYSYAKNTSCSQNLLSSDSNSKPPILRKLRVILLLNIESLTKYPCRSKAIGQHSCAIGHLVSMTENILLLQKDATCSKELADVLSGNEEWKKFIGDSFKQWREALQPSALWQPDDRIVHSARSLAETPKIEEMNIEPELERRDPTSSPVQQKQPPAAIAVPPAAASLTEDRDNTTNEEDGNDFFVSLERSSTPQLPQTATAETATTPSNVSSNQHHNPTTKEDDDADDFFVSSERSPTSQIQLQATAMPAAAPSNGSSNQHNTTSKDDDDDFFAALERAPTPQKQPQKATAMPAAASSNGSSKQHHDMTNEEDDDFFAALERPPTPQKPSQTITAVSAAARSNGSSMGHNSMTSKVEDDDDFFAALERPASATFATHKQAPASAFEEEDPFAAFAASRSTPPSSPSFASSKLVTPSTTTTTTTARPAAMDDDDDFFAALGTRK